jgi:hypothetical protein
MAKYDDVLNYSAEDEVSKLLRSEERRWREAEMRDDPSQLQANGWLLPAKFRAPGSDSNGASSTKNLAQRIAVPVPIHSRPISQDVNVQVCAHG